MPKKRGYKMMTTLFGSFGHQFVKGLSPSGVFGTLGDVVTGKNAFMLDCSEHMLENCSSDVD